MKDEIVPIREKLNDKIRALNSSRVFKKITPKGDLSWYIKWVSSCFIIVAMALSSANVFPLNIIIHMCGVAGWLVVGMLWHDRALIVLNTILLAMLVSGGMRYIVQWMM